MTGEPDPNVADDEENMAPAPPIRGPYLYFAIGLLCILIFLVVFVNFPAMQASAGATMTKNAWQLQTIANASGGMEPAGSPLVTARFGRDGRLEGFAGCNEYRATYTTYNYAINITPPATSLRQCGEAGVMERETAYLDRLGSAAEFRVTDEVLKLYDRNGRPLLGYGAA
jgi:heat shock protein HslJ